ncbi:MAG: FtsX-like permease family protein, partial [Algicola sp.]|nr:FtsX-like permease family protein [Algicola sp.]
PMGALLTVEPSFEEFMTTWNGASVRSYLQIIKGTDIAAFNDKIAKKVNQRAQVRSPEKTYGAFVFPLLDVHLHSTSRAGFIPNGSIAVVYSFTAIALLILFLACINFMNLSTAQATRRAKEVGVRKSLGAYNSQLVVQFIGESVIFSLLGFIVSLALVSYCLPFFNDLLGVQLSFSITGFGLIAGLTLLSIAVGVVAGSYPAFYLSAFKPALVLKGNVSRGSSGIFLRKGLVILQFAIASGLIVSTLVVFQQMKLAQSIPLGYERDNLVIVNKAASVFDTFASQLLTHPDIEYVVNSHVIPTETPRSTTQAHLAGGGAQAVRVDIDNNFVNFDFFKTYNIEVIAGRVFSRDYGQDQYVENSEQPSLSSGNIVLTDELVRRLGVTPDEVLGQTILMGAPDALERLQVVGVVGSSYYNSIRTPIKSMAYYLKPEGRVLDRTTIKIRAGAMSSALSHIDKTWKSVQPGVPVRRTFLDDNYNALYQAEQKQSNMLNVFAALAVIITCLGLFGLASFTTQRRVREIGIRKVLGASRWQISWLITKEFITLVVIANLIAWPVAYYFMRDWLDTFANRIDLGLLVFLASGLLTVLIAWATVGGLAFKAASTKPVNSLRCE